MNDDFDRIRDRNRRRRRHALKDYFKRQRMPPHWRQIDADVRAKAARWIAEGRERSCHVCNNTGWRKVEVPPFLVRWRICWCWVGRLWRRTRIKSGGGL